MNTRIELEREYLQMVSLLIFVWGFDFVVILQSWHNVMCHTSIEHIDQVMYDTFIWLYEMSSTYTCVYMFVIAFKHVIFKHWTSYIRHLAGTYFTSNKQILWHEKKLTL